MKTNIYNNFQVVFVAIVSFLAGIYALWIGISAIKKNKSTDIFDLNEFGRAFYAKIYRSSKIAKIEKEKQRPGYTIRTGIKFIFIGTCFIIGAFFLAFGMFE